MPGLVPGIHALLPLNQRIVEIGPVRIVRVDKPHFPRTRPMLHRLFLLDSSPNILKCFVSDELLQAVAFREAVNETFAMFVRAALNVARHADIEHAVASVSDDVNDTAHEGS